MMHLRFLQFAYSLRVLFLFFCCYFLAGSSRAISAQYDFGVENDLSRETVNPAEFPIVNFGVTLDSNQTDEGKASNSEYRGDVHFKISPTHPKAYALSSKNFYYGEKDESTDSPLRFIYGRRLVNWSKIDEIWSLGVIEPLDSWDRLRPFTQGLTGIFAYSETQSFQFRFFLSYLFLPETTPNIVVENNQFANEHPQAVSTAPQSFNLLSRSTPLGYHLDIPPLSKIILRPSFVFMMETKKHNPLSGKFAYGFLPLNYFPIALQASLAIPLDQIVVQLKPRLINHSIYNGELAYRLNASTRFGFSALFDQPYADNIPGDYTTTPLTTSTHLSPWLQYEKDGVSVTLTQLWTLGGLDPDVGPYANPSASVFSSRMLYRSASQLAIRTELSHEDTHHPVLQCKYIHEYSILADWLAADLYYQFQPRLLAFVGGDILSAQRGVAPDRGAEFLADMRAIDRIRIGVNYVF